MVYAFDPGPAEEEIDREQWEAEQRAEFDGEMADRWEEFIKSDAVNELWTSWEDTAWAQWLENAAKQSNDD